MPPRRILPVRSRTGNIPSTSSLSERGTRGGGGGPTIPLSSSIDCDDAGLSQGAAAPADKGENGNKPPTYELEDGERFHDSTLDNDGTNDGGLQNRHALLAVFENGEKVNVKVKLSDHHVIPNNVPSRETAASTATKDHNHPPSQSDTEGITAAIDDDDRAMATRLPKRKRTNMYSSLSPAVIRATAKARAEAFAAAPPSPQLASSKYSSRLSGGHASHSSRSASSSHSSQAQVIPQVTLSANTSIIHVDNDRGDPAAIAASNALNLTLQTMGTVKVPTEFLGNDGNLFYCRICLGVGEVVCCDGCPHVFHPQCIPSDGLCGKLSTTSLENDDDPWYCHDCVGRGMLGKSIVGMATVDVGGKVKGRKSAGKRTTKKRKSTTVRLEMGGGEQQQ